MGLPTAVHTMATTVELPRVSQHLESATLSHTYPLPWKIGNIRFASVCSTSNLSAQQRFVSKASFECLNPRQETDKRKACCFCNERLEQRGLGTFGVYLQSHEKAPVRKHPEAGFTEPLPQEYRYRVDRKDSLFYEKFQMFHPRRGRVQ